MLNKAGSPPGLPSLWSMWVQAEGLPMTHPVNCQVKSSTGYKRRIWMTSLISITSQTIELILVVLENHKKRIKTRDMLGWCCSAAGFFR